MKEQKQKKHRTAKVITLCLINLIMITIIAVGSVVGYSYVSNQNFKETFYGVSNLKVNNPIRIIQISDLHSCTYGYDNIRLLDRVEKLHPDMIVLTGDCVDEKYSIEPVVEFCAKLANVAPTYYIYGNNEVLRTYSFELSQDNIDDFWGFDSDTRDTRKLLEWDDALAEALTDSGVMVLRNESATLTIGSTNVDIYGVLTSNPSSFWSYAGPGFENYLYTNTNHLKLTLIHEPIIFEEFSYPTWGDLALAGHHHGGLVKIPILGPLYTHEGGILPARKGHFVNGKYDVQGSTVIISTGLENENPLRINNEPELVIIDINRL